MPRVLLEREGEIAWLRLNRPEATAFDAQMTSAFAACVGKLAADREVRAVILCGNGPSFSTGVDVKELSLGDVSADSFTDGTGGPGPWESRRSH